MIASYRKLALLCGMREEAQIASTVSGALVLQGADRNNLETLLAGKGIDRIMSFGVCGALAPLLQVGDLVVGHVRSSDRRYIPWLGDEIAGRLPCFNAPIISASVEQADTAAERDILFIRTGAWAVDDETYAVYAYAKQHQIDYCAVRAVSDDASTTLPTAARNALGPDGSVNIGSVLAALARNPLQIFDLVKVAHDFGKALESLKRAAKVLL